MKKRVTRLCFQSSPKGAEVEIGDRGYFWPGSQLGGGGREGVSCSTERRSPAGTRAQEENVSLGAAEKPRLQLA